METIYLFQRAEVAVSTFFMKSQVFVLNHHCIHPFCTNVHSVHCTIQGCIDINIYFFQQKKSYLSIILSKLILKYVNVIFVKDQQK